MYYTENDILRLRQNLELYCDDFYQALVKKTALSRGTISKFLNFQKVLPKNRVKIYREALKLIKDQKQFGEDLSSEIEDILDPLQSKTNNLQPW